MLEVDPDLEDNGDAEAEADDEPSLGSLDRVPQTRWAEGPPSYHFDHDLELDTADDEPSLGSLTSCGSNASQGDWADGSSDDRERTGFATESDDEEDSLGWTIARKRRIRPNGDAAKISRAFRARWSSGPQLELTFLLRFRIALRISEYCRRRF